VSRQEGATWSELIALALRQEPALLACYPLKERSSTELALLAAAHTRVLGVLNQPDVEAALRWLLKNQLRSPLKAGVLKGVLSVVSVPTLCPNCRLPATFAGRGGKSYELFTRQGCEKCLSWESLPTEEVLEWLPLGPGTAKLLETKLEPADLRKHLEDQGGVPLFTRILRRAEEGALEGGEARLYLP
jgi:type II secretory ATPase GspE/PulE/Tfp pilus assembly ATPase PilB-like protein